MDRIYKRGGCLFSLNAFAQDLFPKFGLKTGLSYGKASVSASGISVDLDYRTGFKIGGFAEFPVNEYLSIQPEILYVQKGAELNVPSYGNEKDRVHMLEVPVLAKVNIPIEASPVKPFFYAGPFAGIKLGSHYEATIRRVGVLKA